MSDDNPTRPKVNWTQIKIGLNASWQGPMPKKVNLQTDACIHYVPSTNDVARSVVFDMYVTDTKFHDTGFSSTWSMPNLCDECVGRRSKPRK